MKTVKIENELHKKLKILAAQDETELRLLIEEILQKYLTGKIKRIK